MKGTGHVQSLNYDDIIKRILNQIPDIKRRVENSKLIWINSILEVNETTGREELVACRHG